MNTKKPLQKIQVVADYLGVHHCTVRRLIESGKLDSVKIRGLRLVRTESLLKLLEPSSR